MRDVFLYQIPGINMFFCLTLIGTTVVGSTFLRPEQANTTRAINHVTGQPACSKVQALLKPAQLDDVC